MRCLKSFSVHQKDSQPSSVYTAHVHPHGNWLATGGADNHVKIWDLPRMLARTSIAQIPHDVDAVVHDSLLPRCPPAALPERALVALLAKHSKAVNCVKWSSIGQYLASGSDDSLILLWEAQGVSSTSWLRISTLRGHEMDVLDLAWSSNGEYLASCSIDSRVLLWNMKSRTAMMTPMRVLTGHSNWVKGVAWDPVGRFLASASEDRRASNLCRVV
mmetsp:Transcript_2632/g.8808  ORF Transcript_2632/g.8808 Transcript_2632/m.8808 type:complete len:216 (+) Transcript_2632:79-726(+)